MTKRYCEKCATRRDFKPFNEGLYRSDGETVEVCKVCGHLRTATQIAVIEPEIVYKPTQTKKKNMEDE